MKEDGTFEIGDRFILPCGKESAGEVFIIVGIRKFKEDVTLEAICKGSEMTISVNSNYVEMLGMEFHTG